MHYKIVATIINTDSSHTPFPLVTLVHFNDAEVCARCTQRIVIRICFQPGFTQRCCQPSTNTRPAAERRERKSKQRVLTRGQHATDLGSDTKSVSPTGSLGSARLVSASTSDNRARYTTIYVLNFNSIFPLRSHAPRKHLCFHFTDKEINEKRGHNNFLPYLLKVGDKMSRKKEIKPLAS